MIYLVRHGRTVWNREGRFQGQRDSPLLPEGRDQAAAAAEALRDRGITRLFTSPLGRSADTAATVGRAVDLAPVPDDRLMECAYGVTEGLTTEEIEAQHPGLWAWRDADKWSRAFPGGESYALLASRLAGFVQDRLVNRSQDAGATCVVSHRGVNRGIAGLLLGWTAAQVLACDQGNDQIFQIAGTRFETITLSLA